MCFSKFKQLSNRGKLKEFMEDISGDFETQYSHTNTWDWIVTVPLGPICDRAVPDDMAEYMYTAEEDREDTAGYDDDSVVCAISYFLECLERYYESGREDETSNKA
jgi:hypothetical protein